MAIAGFHPEVLPTPFAGVDLGERRSSISGDRGGTADGIIV